MKYLRLTLGLCACTLSTFAAPSPEYLQALRSSVPLSLAPTTVRAGGLSVRAEPLKLPDNAFVGEKVMEVSGDILVMGDRLIVAEYKNVLRAYRLPAGRGQPLQVDRTFGENGVIEFPAPIRRIFKMTRLNDREFAVTTNSGTARITDGQLGGRIQLGAAGILTMAADGSWGVTHNTGSSSEGRTAVSLIEPSGDGFTVTPWIKQKPDEPELGDYALGTTVCSAIIGDRLYFAGSSVQGYENRFKQMGRATQVICLERDATRVFRFGSTDLKGDFTDDLLGHVSDIEGTATHIVALDANRRRLVLLTKAGKFAAFLSLEELTGIKNSLWSTSLAPAADGSFYLLASGVRKDGKVAEAAVFRLTGL